MALVGLAACGGGSGETAADAGMRRRPRAESELVDPGWLDASSTFVPDASSTSVLDAGVPLVDAAVAALDAFAQDAAPALDAAVAAPDASVLDAAVAAPDASTNDAGAPPNASSPVGTNLDGPSDWSTEHAFVDVFRMSRAWFSGSATQWNDRRTIAVDADGWVTALARDQIARTLVLSNESGHYPAGDYIVLYDGRGTIEYFNSGTKDIARSTPGRDVLHVDPSRGVLGLFITATDPTDYIRNIRVIVPGGVCVDDPYASCASAADCTHGGACSLFVDNYATQVFHPRFLDRIRNYRTIRFMTWMRTNSSTEREWADRAELTDATWSVKGVPIEVIVELSNRVQADAWVNVPHAASDDYVARMARLLEARLAPSRRLHVEYSNEVWNSRLPQFAYAMAQGLALGLSTNEFEALLRFYSMRSVWIFRAFRAALGADAGRLVRVLAGQASNVWTSNTMLDFQNAYQETDALAIAPYFGAYLGLPEQQSRVRAMTADDLFAEIERVALPEVRTWLTAHATSAQRHRVALIAYEGGQHLAGVLGVENDERINALFDAANRDPRMRSVYTRYLSDWRQAGGQLFVHLSSCGGWSKWGRWGALEHLDQPRAAAPKFDALQTFIETNPAWW